MSAHPYDIEQGLGLHGQTNLGETKNMMTRVICITSLSEVLCFQVVAYFFRMNFLFWNMFRFYRAVSKTVQKVLPQFPLMLTSPKLIMISGYFLKWFGFLSGGVWMTTGHATGRPETQT